MRYPKIEFDRLKILFGDPLVIDLEGAAGTVTVKPPTIGDIIKIGEGRFYSTLSVLVGNTTQYRLMLWNAGIDWCTISDFQMFTMMYKELDKDVVNLLFDNIDFEKFELYSRKKEDDSEEVFLYYRDEDDYDGSSAVEITEDVYQYFHQYLQTVFNMKPEEEITKDRHLKEWWIRKDNVELAKKEKEREKGKHSSFSFAPLISAYVNHAGTKHNLQELREVGVAEFFDSLKRIQIYEQSVAILRGMYSGFVDTKNIDPSSYDFTRDI